MKKVNIYYIDNSNYLSLFGKGLSRNELDNDSLKNLYYYNWLYYASYSPIWFNRIQLHNGKIDNDKQLIVFDTDDDEDDFYNKYNYEPDEQ